MRLSVEATPDELLEKSELLVSRLSGLVRFAAPDLAAALEKALPPKEQVLKYPVLRALQEKTEKLYAEHMTAMLAAVARVLDGSIEKSFDHTRPIADKDAEVYARVKRILIKFGRKKADFEEGGALYGVETNQLLELAQRLGRKLEASRKNGLR